MPCRRPAMFFFLVLTLSPPLHSQAIPPRQAAYAAFMEGIRLANLQTREGYQKAIPLLLSAARGYHKLGARKEEGAALSSIGDIYSNTGESEKALEFYYQSLFLLIVGEDSRGEGHALSSIGYLYSSTGRPDKALHFLNRALAVERADDDRIDEVDTLNDIGSVYSNTGEPEKALEFLNQALLLIPADDKGREAATLSNIGHIYLFTGQPEKALGFFDRVLPLVKAVGNKNGEGATLSNIGAAYLDTGQPGKALKFFDEALPLARAVGDKRGAANTLSNMGEIYSNTGRPEKALEFFDKALPLLIAVGDRSIEANDLSNIGAVYGITGQPEKALDFFTRALGLQRTVGDRSGEANSLINIGAVYSDIGQPEKAIDFFNQALPLERAVGDRKGQAVTLNNIGSVYSNTGRPEKALEFFTGALSLRKAVGDRKGEAYTLNNIGLVYYHGGQSEKALEFYDQALPLDRAVGDKSGEATTLANRADINHRLHKENDAAADYEGALEAVNSIVGSITQDELKRSTSQNYQWIYDGYITFLMDQANLAAIDDPRISRALEVSEAARARALRDLLAGSASQLPSSALRHPASAPGRPAPPTKAATAGRTQPGILRGTSLRSVAPEVPRMVEGLPPLTSTSSAEPFKRRDVIGLSQGGAILSYHIVTDHLVIFVVDAGGHLHAAYREIAAPDLLDLIQRTREALAARDDPDEKSRLLTQLYQLLIAPALPWLPKDTGNKPLLTVAPFGPLLELPFAALRSPDGHYLCESYALRETPSLTVLRYTGERSKALKDASMQAVVFANPVPPVKMDALPAAEAEAHEISSLLGAGQAKPLMKSGADATEILFRKMAPAATEIHLATHGWVDEEQPLYSGVILGKSEGPETEYERDGFLTVAEVFRLKLNCRMVVLSACETGLGPTSADGVFGLQNAFLSAGSASLLSTLWKVNDTATAQLMTGFYRKLMADPGHNRARALGEAQVSLLQGAATKDPYYWASFVLTGEAS